MGASGVGEGRGVGDVFEPGAGVHGHAMLGGGDGGCGHECGDEEDWECEGVVEEREVFGGDGEGGGGEGVGG